MAVFDASVLVDALVNDGVTGTLARAELGAQPVLDVPDTFKAEAVSALRALVHRGDITASRARLALEQVRDVAVASYPFEPFLDRVWELRQNMTAYDGWYVALAESLTTDLVTTDDRLTKAPGPRCAVRLPRPVREPAQEE